MSRLATELHRLYHCATPGLTCALGLEIAAPADWAALGTVWRGVQTDLGLPAPAIAVSGTDGLQLWFSLAQPVSTPQAAEFLAALQARYLPELAAPRVRLRVDGGTPAVPVQDLPTGNWSAFVAPDLAPVFADTPWLDIEPGADGQADLLARLVSAAPADFEAALRALRPAAVADVAVSPRVPSVQRLATDLDPREFLQRVLNDDSVPLALRVEAAKALLQQP